MNKWISIKDRLPEINSDTKLIVSEYSHYKNKKFVSVYYYMGENDWQNSFGESLDTSEYEVTHWMPLPEPPK